MPAARTVARRRAAPAAAAGTLAELLIGVWRQMLDEGRSELSIAGRTIPVGRTRGRGLRTATVHFGELAIDAIAQNPETGSRWA